MKNLNQDSWSLGPNFEPRDLASMEQDC